MEISGVVYVTAYPVRDQSRLSLDFSAAKNTSMNKGLMFVLAPPSYSVLIVIWCAGWGSIISFLWPLSPRCISILHFLSLLSPCPLPEGHVLLDMGTCAAGDWKFVARKGFKPRSSRSSWSLHMVDLELPYVN